MEEKGGLPSWLNAKLNIGRARRRRYVHILFARFISHKELKPRAGIAQPEREDEGLRPPAKIRSVHKEQIPFKHSPLVGWMEEAGMDRTHRQKRGE